MANIPGCGHIYFVIEILEPLTTIYSVFRQWNEVREHLRKRRGEKMSEKISDPITLNLPEPVSP